MLIANYETSNNSTPEKNWFFWFNPYKTEVTIPSFIEMLELPSFGHMITSTISFELRDKILLVTSQTEIMML